MKITSQITVVISLLLIIGSCSPNTNINSKINSEQTTPHSNQWDSITPFSEGLAGFKKDSLWGFMNRKGEVIIPAQYEFIRNFQLGTCSVAKGDPNSNSWHAKEGLIDVSGNLLLPIIYDRISDVHEGLRSVIINDSVGFVDSRGEFIIPISLPFGFDEALPEFHENRCAILTDLEKEHYGFIDTTGVFVIEPNLTLWGGAAAYHYPIFSDGLCVYQSNKKFGFMDVHGRSVIPAKFDGADDFSEGLAAVLINGQVQFINVKGEIAIDAQFGPTDTGAIGFYYGSFKEGRCEVILEWDGDSPYGENTVYGVIDSKGNILEK